MHKSVLPVRFFGWLQSGTGSDSKSPGAKSSITLCVILEKSAKRDWRTGGMGTNAKGQLLVVGTYYIGAGTSQCEDFPVKHGRR